MSTSKYIFRCVVIPLTKDQFTRIDLVDADLAKLLWHAQKDPIGNYRAARSIRIGNKTSMIFIHRIILERKLNRELKPGEFADHSNGNSLCNIRANLRIASHTQNMRNRKRNVNNKSGFKGVSATRNRWRALIYVDKKKISLGCFDTPEEAYAAYCKAAIKYHGEFARLK